jgi:cell division protein FtsN
MKRFWMAAGIAALCAGGSAVAQTNGLDPANLPPEGFDGREFVDSAGCSFLRSTFGGEVTWVPRYGPDRNPICGQSPTDFTTVAASAPAVGSALPEGDSTESEPAAIAAAPDAQPAAAPDVPSGRIEVVGAVADPVRRPAPSFLGKEPQVASVAPRRSTPPAAPKPRLPQADASGRHPSCPDTSPYGQLVDTELGRKMVRCVTSPALFLDEYVNTPRQQQVAHAPRAAVGHGARVQVGSFAVHSNAQRLVARLRAAGLPAGSYSARGLSVVTVGPFGSGAEAHGALSQVRSMGFRDAFLRR